MIAPVEIHLYCAVCGSDLEAAVDNEEIAVKPCAHCRARELVTPHDDRRRQRLAGVTGPMSEALAGTPAGDEGGEG